MQSSVVRRLTFAVVAVALTALFAACGGSSSPTAPTPPPKGTVQVLDDHFNPSSITVKVGDTVTWKWGGSHDHSVTEGTTLGGTPAFDSGVKTSGTFVHQFTTAETVHYFCSIHFPNMKGTVTVTP